MRIDPTTVKKLQGAKGLSREEFAEIAKVSTRTLDNVAAGKEVSNKTARKIAKGLDVEISDIVVDSSSTGGHDIALYVSASVPLRVREALELATKSVFPDLGIFVASENCQFGLLEKCAGIVVYSASESIEESIVKELIYALGRRMQILVLHPEGQSVRLPSVCDAAKADVRVEVDCKSGLAALREWCDASEPVVQIQHLLTLVADGSGRWPAAYQGPLISSRVKQAYDEVRDIAARSYKVAISFENEYLQRATQVFETAKRVYATSLDGISTFWSEADEYIKIQPTNTVRWFIFRDGNEIGRIPSQAIHSLLDEHSAQYGDVGCVLVGRHAEYQHFIESHWPKDQIEPFLNLDFALLEHETNKGTEWSFASLSRHEFSVQHFDDSHPCYSALIKFKSVMEGIRRADHARGNVQSHADIGSFVRWEPQFAQNRTRDFISLLDNLYQRERIVTHMVFLDIERESPEIRNKCKWALIKAMNRIKSRLSAYKRSFGLSDIRFGQKVDVFESGQTDPNRPRIITEPVNRNEVCLIMTFEDRSQRASFPSATSSLRRYYNDKEHVDDRYSLYGEMGGVLEPVGRLHSQLTCCEHDAVVKEILGECLEREVTKYLIRRDYVDDLAWKDVFDY
jgi:transcriptional regulator with XRE-family HTH domain